MMKFFLKNKLQQKTCNFNINNSNTESVMIPYKNITTISTSFVKPFEANGSFLIH